VLEPYVSKLSLPSLDAVLESEDEEDELSSAVAACDEPLSVEAVGVRLSVPSELDEPEPSELDDPSWLDEDDPSELDELDECEPSWLDELELDEPEPSGWLPGTVAGLPCWVSACESELSEL
jgi:hypothetical protein